MFIYVIHPKQVPLENMTTSGTGNTEIDAAFIKPGASRPVIILTLRVQGKGAGLTALSGLVLRQKQWTSTASSGGTAATPFVKNNLAPASVATAGIATTAGGAVTSGTGGPGVFGMASMGQSGPGGVAPINPDDSGLLDGGANKSVDLFSSCPTASLNYEFSQDLQEG